MMKPILLFVAITVFAISHQAAYAIGGKGATCNPSTSNWGNCSLAVIPFKDQVSSTINIPGGSYALPYIADKAYTRYVLQGNIIAESIGIVVEASYVILDLNGYTITYNEHAAGEGVTIGSYNLHHIAVQGGSIIQGSAMSEGDQYGRGNNTVGTYNSALGSSRSVHNLHISNLYVRYGGKDVGGIICAGNDGLYEQNTIEDTYEFGTLKNRHQGVEALTGSKNVANTGNVYRNNTIINTRQRGIVTGNSSEVYGNHITLRSIATNSNGVGQYAGQDIVIHDNTIIGTGEHPVGIGAGGGDGSNNYEVYNNVITLQTTALGEEYGSSYKDNPTATYQGNSAAGFRLTWGGDNINVYDNQITITTNSSYTGTYSPTGETAYIDGGGKGFFIGIYDGEVSTFSNNTISVTGDGSYTYGVTCSYNFSDGLFVLGNTITSSQYNLVLGDDYGPCNDYPLFQNNTLVKTGSSDDYMTIINTYNYIDRHVQARLVDNNYINGASASQIDLQPQSAGLTDIYFGTIVDGVPAFTYRLHDNAGTSDTLLKEDFSPAITLNYNYPNYTPSTTETSPVILNITEK